MTTVTISPSSPTATSSAPCGCCDTCEVETHNTGTSGVGTTDTYWTVNGGPAYVVGPVVGVWAATPGEYICADPSGSVAPGTYSYATQIIVGEGCDLESLEISLEVTGDDLITGVYLNGTLIHTGGQFYTPTALTLTGLVAGANDLVVEVVNTIIYPVNTSGMSLGFTGVSG